MKERLRGFCKPVTHRSVTCKARDMPHCMYVLVYNIYQLVEIRKSKDCSRCVSRDTFMIESRKIFNIENRHRRGPTVSRHQHISVFGERWTHTFSRSSRRVLVKKINL